MNRDTFNRIYGHSSISESEMDRKYRVYIREQEELQWLSEAAAVIAQQTSVGTNASGQYDADAYKFIKATNITDVLTRNYINLLVTYLKTWGLWDNIKAIYPMVGGNATAHSYNLKDTTKFRIDFYGGWVHSATGAKPNGWSSYATTGFNPVTEGFSNANAHIGYYVRTAAARNERLTGVSNGTDDEPIYLISRYGNGQTIFAFGGNTGPTARVTVSTANGFLQLNRNGSVTNGSINGIVRATSVQTVASFTNLSFYLGCSRILYYGNYRYSDKECAFATFGDSLTVDQANKFYTGIQQFQTNLGRQV